MNQSKTLAAIGLTFLTPAVVTPASLAAPVCVALHDGVEYRTYLPDAKRFVYVAVKVLPGVFPTVFVIIDKNYESAAKLAVNDPMNRWWLNRANPFSFSGDTVRVRWHEGHTFDFVTDLFSDNPPKELAQPIRGIAKVGDRYEGPGANDTNTFAFQVRLDMNGFTEDYFEVSVPSVTYDGAKVTPPVVHFERGDNKAMIAKCG